MANKLYNTHKVCESRRITEQVEESPSGARLTKPPLHHGDLEKGRPYKITHSQKEDITMMMHQALQKYGYKEIVIEESSDPTEPRV